MKQFSLYMIREIMPLYLAGLVVLVILLLGVALLEVLADIIARGADIGLVSKMMLYSFPSAASFGIPLALLFAAVLGITRLVQDSEMKAGLMLGLSPREFMLPLLSLGLIVSGLSFLNNELLVPWSTQQMLEAQKDIFIQSPGVFLKEGNFFKDDVLRRSIYIESLGDNGEAQGITVIQSGGIEGPREVVQAKRGVLDEQAGVWRLEEVRFTSYTRSDVKFDATASEARLPIRKLTAGHVNQPELIRRFSIPELFTQLRENGGYQPEVWTALHRKFAEPLAATAFALFAIAVGLFSFRSGFGLGLVSVLFLTFMYYATWSVARLLGAQGTIPGWLAGWLPVGLYLLVSLVLFTWSWRR